MRVIEEIQDPRFKISIFYMNQKYLLKFEQGNLEQTYKLSELDFVIRDHEDLKRILTPEFLTSVEKRFQDMASPFYTLAEELF